MRQAGILLHISSLPGKYDIGSLGQCAYDFVDFLVSSGQSAWQIMPIGPTSYGDSPYQGVSAFAYNPYFIDLDLLVSDGLLNPSDLPEATEPLKADYGNLYYHRFEILHKAYLNRDKVIQKFYRFCKKEEDWLTDYSLYMVLKKMHNDIPWYQWRKEYKLRDKNALDKLMALEKDKIREWKFIQFLFYDQWVRLHKYAKDKGVELIGDLPMYSAYDSVDVWSHPEYFQLDKKKFPLAIAGCPPDLFSDQGQVWGNPLYDWKYMKKDGYSYWVKRIEQAMELFDVVRLDHFRGFAGYYSIPYWSINAIDGHWEKGPGYALFEEIEKRVPRVRIIAEDLGTLTPDVFQLMRDTGYPGMHVFQFELGNWNEEAPLKGKFPEDSVFYSGTHDNQTIASFYESKEEWQKLFINSIVGIVWGDVPSKKIVEFCLRTRPKLCIIPFQDYLGLFDEVGRMNTPAKSGGNWQYMTKKEDFSKEISHYILKVTKDAGR